MVRLGDVATKIGSGATPRGGASVYVNDGPAFIRSQNVYDHTFSAEGLVRLSDEAAHALRGVTVEEGDVLICITGESVTRTALVPDWVLPARVSQHVAIIRANKSTLFPEYLEKCLLAPRIKAELNRLSEAGATRRALTKSHLESLEIPLPPLKEQWRIARVLGALDDLIDADRRMALDCSNLAQSLWNESVAGCEPNRSLGRTAKIVLGGTPARNKPEFWGGEIPWLNSGKANDFRVTQASEFIAQAGLDKSNTKLMPIGTTIVAITGATLGQVSRLEIAACGNQSLVGVYAADVAVNDYLYFGIRDQIDVLVRSATGGAQQHVNKANVEELLIKWSSEETIRAWHSAAGPLLNATADLLREAEELEDARDELLPLLMSGAVRVRPEGVAT